jgi:hypothetical protein
LDKTAEVLGFQEKVSPPLLPAPMSGYATPGVEWGVLGTSLAGAAGTVVVFGLAWLLARALVPRTDRPAAARFDSSS